ncbi:MAG: bifunctional UDP-N-acetylglucosamine diphosphorylase/glucosamine-1-phosphate N-acetyltransferase GlmU [Acidobacteria bacterium]|nr:bifunctional UDP-N-acetylglucosamine diphosphorylase/glucosamine-1-phosphate N-acetyltransferase GlmU [Acidobacteriota bacterium]
MRDLHVVVLAAGKGTRMKSAVPKLLHQAHGLPLIEHVIRTASALQPASIIVVVGHQAELLRAGTPAHDRMAFAVQEPQLGTGHALLQAEPFLRGARGTLVLLSGDVPLLRAETVRSLVARHEERGAAATVVTAALEDPAGYGRIVRDGDQLAAIVEDKDATPEQRGIREINSGIYALALEPLFDALRNLGTGNAQREYYLTDLIDVYRRRGLIVDAMIVADPREVLGVNSRRELADVTAILKSAKNQALMAAGVTLVDPASAYIGPDVTVGPDTIVQPGVHLEGKTVVGANCVIHAGVRIVDSTIEDGVVINNFCVIVGSHVSAGARIGPLAHIRPESRVGENAHVGNFVELKKTSLGSGSKANHLSYLGDATIGSHVNVGAGTITCNYDGRVKSQTIIEDGAFIGSDSQLIAPVRVGAGAYVAAGSSITEDVPAGSLAVARSRQVTKDNWASNKKIRDKG